MPTTLSPDEFLRRARQRNATPIMRANVLRPGDARPPAPKSPVLTQTQKILLEVGIKHGYTPDELKGKRRRHALVLARHEAMYRLRTETGLSFPQIGLRLGGRDHSTVIHGVKTHCKRNGLELPA